MDLLKNTLHVWAMRREPRAVLADLSTCSDREPAGLRLARAAYEAERHVGEPHWPSREERQRILREAYRLRAEAQARIFGWPVRALARLARRAAAALASTEPGKRAALARLYRREFEAVRSELGSYTNRELARDLLFPRSEIDGIAAKEAARRVAQFVGAHPEYREAWYGRGRQTSLALQNG